jgi:hypothetical protein
MTTRQSEVTFNKPRRFWFELHPTSLNWLALGVLLAAWNAADNDVEPLRTNTCTAIFNCEGHKNVN